MTTSTSAARRRPMLAAILAGSAALALVIPAAAHAEESVTIDFASYVLGDDHPNTADGWNVWSNPPARYDWALVDASGFPAAELGDGVALRFSNSVNNDNALQGINQLNSPSIEAAGEPSTGAVNNTFETSFVVASTTGGVQSNLSVTIALDNGAASRSGGAFWLVHSATGLQIVTSNADYGSSPTTWTTAYSPEYDPSVPHEIRAVTSYVVDGADRLEVYVDGALALTSGTFEAYHRSAGSAASSQRSNSLLFRASTLISQPAGSIAGIGPSEIPDATEKAALLGQGFLFTDLAYRSYNVVPATEPVLPPTPPAPTLGTDLELDETTPGEDTPVTAEVEGMLPGELVAFTAYSTPTFLGYAIADATGRASLTFRPKTFGLTAGAHTIVATGVTSARTATTQLTVHALAVTGVEAEDGLPILIGGGILLVAGGTLALLGRARPWRRRVHARRQT